MPGTSGTFAGNGKFFISDEQMQEWKGQSNENWNKFVRSAKDPNKYYGWNGRALRLGFAAAGLAAGHFLPLTAWIALLVGFTGYAAALGLIAWWNLRQIYKHDAAAQAKFVPLPLDPPAPEPAAVEEESPEFSTKGVA